MYKWANTSKIEANEYDGENWRKIYRIKSSIDLFIPEFGHLIKPISMKKWIIVDSKPIECYRIQTNRKVKH